MPSNVIRRFMYVPDTHELTIEFVTGRRYELNVQIAPVLRPDAAGTAFPDAALAEIFRSESRLLLDVCFGSRADLQDTRLSAGPAFVHPGATAFAAATTLEFIPRSVPSV